MLILGNNVDLIIPEETIHQREDFTSGAIVDNLVDEGGRKVVFWTSFVNIHIINAYTHCALFLVDQDKIGNPVSEGHRVNKVGFKKFLDFELDSSPFTWVNWMKALPVGFSVEVCLDLMYHNVGVDTWHFFIAPGENISKFLKEGCVSCYLLRGAVLTDMYILDYSKFH